MSQKGYSHMLVLHLKELDKKNDNAYVSVNSI